MKNRLIVEGLITTIIGLLIISISIYMWTSQKASQTESLLMAGLGLIFLRAKSSLIGLGPKKEKE
tara:strand:- start:24459 stop:24653 length:195 start_codon:yes stop_codon:yes gene_type:complete